MLAAIVPVWMAGAAEPAVDIGPKGEIRISQQGLPSLTFYPTFFAEGRFVGMNNPVMDQAGGELSAAQSISLPSGAEIRAKVSTQAGKEGASVALSWGGGIFESGSAFLTLQIPQEISSDVTVTADGKAILVDGAATGAFIGGFTSLEVARSADGKVLFEVTGAMSGVDAFEPGKGSRTRECLDLRIRRKMSEGQELGLNISFPE